MIGSFNKEENNNNLTMNLRKLIFEILVRNISFNIYFVISDDVSKEYLLVDIFCNPQQCKPVFPILTIPLRSIFTLHNIVPIIF